MPALPDANANDPKRFSCPAGADSTRKTSAPVSWPATLRPWTTRHATKRHVASDPAAAYVGSSPMAAVAPAIDATDSCSAARRPYASLNAPTTSPPTGRTRNAAPKTMKVSRRREFGSPGAKNNFDSSGAKNPKRAKSYHSSALPAAVARRRSWWRSRFGVSLTVSPSFWRSS